MSNLKRSTPHTALEIRLFDTLKRIATGYMTPDQIRRDAEKGGIQADAKRAVHGLRIKRP